MIKPFLKENGFDIKMIGHDWFSHKNEKFKIIGKPKKEFQMRNSFFKYL